jgi:hypothetical protein
MKNAPAGGDNLRPGSGSSTTAGGGERPGTAPGERLADLAEAESVLERGAPPAALPPPPPAPPTQRHRRRPTISCAQLEPAASDMRGLLGQRCCWWPRLARPARWHTHERASHSCVTHPTASQVGMSVRPASCPPGPPEVAWPRRGGCIREGQACVRRAQARWHRSAAGG